jgi:hypothetical protein
MLWFVAATDETVTDGRDGAERPGRRGLGCQRGRGAWTSSTPLPGSGSRAAMGRGTTAQVTARQTDRQACQIHLPHLGACAGKGAHA